ncbi:MAG TPA: hypothetical protein VKW76_06310 [Candidatus Binatia bacterium]|nr:hypothetical protein [Candidatus Binatia bacterium]
MRSTFVGTAAFLVAVGALLARAVTVHSVAYAPLIYRATVNNNDLDSVEGLAPPGSFVELWYRQRNFIEGNPSIPSDPFSWCPWKNSGTAVRIGWTWADQAGVFRLKNLREATTVMLFPAKGAGGTCAGGIYTELLPRACDAPGVNCSAWAAPTLNWLNVLKGGGTAQATGAETGAEQAAIAIADGPDTGTQWGDMNDVDQNAIDTTQPGFAIGQHVSWRCGAGGTAVCPSIAVHDASTAISADAEYPFLLGTLQAHRHGGSFVAAAAAVRNQTLGFTVNVNVKFRGSLDINLGCDNKKSFDFSRGLVS